MEICKGVPGRERHAALPGVDRMSPRDIRNLGASVRQRLFNLAKQRGDDFEILLTRYAIERLLYRLSQSPHSEQLRQQFQVKWLGGCPSRPTASKLTVQPLFQLPEELQGLWHLRPESRSF